MLVNTYHITKDGLVSEITLKPHTPPAIAKKIADEPIFNLFSRIQSELPLENLKRKLVIGVGVGSGRGFYEGLARCGVSNFMFMDHDYVEDVNVATQHSTVSEIGKRKVNALKERILDINPQANVTAVSLKLDDNLSDEGFESLVGDQLITQVMKREEGFRDYLSKQAYGGRIHAVQLYADEPEKNRAILDDVAVYKNSKEDQEAFEAFVKENLR